MSTHNEPKGGSCPCCHSGQRHAGHLLCASCWGLVPSFQQQAVTATWRRWKHAGGGDAALINKRRKEYLQARDAALATATAAAEPIPVDVARGGSDAHP